MPAMGNKFSCSRMNAEDVEEARSPPKEWRESKLVRVGSRILSKDTHVSRKMNFGFEVGRSETGLRFKSLNEVEGTKERSYRAVGGKLPTAPGVESLRPPSPIPEE